MGMGVGDTRGGRVSESYVGGSRCRMLGLVMMCKDIKHLKFASLPLAPQRLREEEVVRARRELERLRDLVASRGARGRSGGGQGRDGAGRGESRRPGDAGRTGWAPEAPVDVIRARRDEVRGR